MYKDLFEPDIKQEPQDDIALLEPESSENDMEIPEAESLQTDPIKIECDVESESPTVDIKLYENHPAINDTKTDNT
jgi:hypothetical protein